MFRASHIEGLAGRQRVAWPDGATTLEQYAVTVKMFEVIEAQMAAEAEHANQ